MPSGALMDRHVIAQSVEELAERPALGTRKEELTALAAALRNQDATELDPWSELDLLAAYARPESLRAGTGQGGGHPLWSYAEGVLGALVFVPLMLTWYGLTRASSAYGALTGADPGAASRPFLQLWQSGFEGHLTGAFTFGHVAMSATVAITLLFALVLVHGLRRSAVARREEDADRGREELLAALVPVLTRAQLVLNGRRSSSPRRFAAELTEAAVTLRRLGDKAVRVQKDLTSAASAVGDAVRGAERALAGVDTSVKPLETAVGRVEAAVSDGGERVRKALDDVRDVSGEVRLAVQGAGDRVEDSVTVLAASQRAYATGIEVASDVSAQLLGRFGEVAEGTARAVEESQHAVRELNAQSGALRAAADEFARLVAELRADRLPPATLPDQEGWPGRDGQAGLGDRAGATDGHGHRHDRSADVGRAPSGDAGHAPSADMGHAPAGRLGRAVEQADAPADGSGAPAGRYGPAAGEPGRAGPRPFGPRREPPQPPPSSLTEAR
ncbi:methyl-accepting chemotaxis protein [Streptomyces triticiradicis]|uniref:Methyl-accepting chemotaxis protein n=1 Tax=Streptomyces triticiradicis TaxID=2651189 RepID=A0A7J5DBS3_9ACTN|nr:methyl-accepting chemotaxis protein [Streptomyces triticiradicis]KAB1986276.1 methyl-accepting chemotaxis protein [Streptomyces triticiradicis]